MSDTDDSWTSRELVVQRGYGQANYRTRITDDGDDGITARERRWRKYHPTEPFPWRKSC